jgi:hypothetical protein
MTATASWVAASKKMEPQITRNTRIDADEAEVNRPSNRIVWLYDALA